LYLAGRADPLSVVTSFELPNQPAVGSTVLQPLGGNGFTSPHSVYQIQSSLVSDASVGASNLYIRFDPRYVQVVANVLIAVNSGAAAITVNASIRGELGGRLQIRHSMADLPVSGLGATAQVSWTPEPMAVSASSALLATELPYIRATIDNVDTETLTIYALVYNFDKNARERVPLTDLFSFLTRTGGVI